MKTFNLNKFTEFCLEHPELRYFQALCAFLEVDSVEVRNGDTYQDTFFWEDEVEKKERYMPELGQAMHGNPTGWYEIPPFAEALILSILDEKYLKERGIHTEQEWKGDEGVYKVVVEVL